MAETAIDVEVIEQAVSVELRETAVEALLSGPRGQTGDTGQGAALEVPFAFGDSSPKPITIALAGKLVYDASILITETFDGAGAVLVLGDSSIPDRLIAASEDAPGALGTYTTHPNVAYMTSTGIFLTITPGAGATQGAGLLTLVIQA